MIDRDKIFQSIKWNTLTVGFVAILVFVQTYILLRYLSKEDFGIMAIINAVYFYIRSINTASVNASIIYIDDIEKDQEKLSTIFWFLLTLNIVLVLFVVAFSGTIGEIYESADIVNGVRIFSVVLVMDFVTAIYKTLLHKKMAFEKLFYVLTFSKLIAFFIAVFLAVKGYGYLSLLYSFLVYAFLEMVICVCYGASTFRPRWSFRPNQLKSVINFGVYETGMRLTGEFRKQADVIIIGKVFGLELLGVYSVLKNVLIKLYKLINPLFSTIGIPWIAKEKSNLTLSRKIFFGQCQLLAAILSPIYIGLIVFASPVIFIYFGEDYNGNETLFSVLAFAYFIGFTISLSGTVITAYGRVSQGFYWSLKGLVLYLISMFLLKNHGTEGIAVALIIYFSYMLISLDYTIIRKTLDVPFTSLLRAVLPIMCISLIAGAIILLLKAGNQSFEQNLLLQVGLYISITSSALWLFKKRLFEKELLSEFL